MGVELETGEVDTAHIDVAHACRQAMIDFEKFGKRFRIGGALLFDGAVPDPFSDSPHTADVKRVAADVAAAGDLRVVKSVRKLMQLERVA